MIDERELRTHARGAASALRVMGPTDLTNVVRMLCALELTDEEALSVVHYGRQHALLVDGDGGQLLAGPDADVPGVMSQPWPPPP